MGKTVYILDFHVTGHKKYKLFFMCSNTLTRAALVLFLLLSTGHYSAVLNGASVTLSDVV